MKLSEKGAKLLVEREGFKLNAYKDSKGIPTIGVGHTGPEVKLGLVWSKEKVTETFKKDVGWAEAAVNDLAGPINQDQFDALVSFVFNIGAEAFENSTMKKMLDEGDYYNAAIQFDRWHKPAEVISRRNAERDQFKGIDFVARK